MGHSRKRLAHIHFKCSNATSRSVAVKRRAIVLYLSKVVSEVVPSPIMHKLPNVVPSKRKPRAGPWSFCGHFFSLKMQAMIMIAIIIASIKSQTPGGPLLKGHVRLSRVWGIALSSSAKAGDTLHDNANKRLKR